ncbi:uncharacterized protein LOC134271580 [Saccostrea cucullata]|uniref:uncharacterized protein LOC134271580 n=1 Tax=Saccostrea cuccullata TaxID=36930 RepID=UPI002ED32FA2
MQLTSVAVHARLNCTLDLGDLANALMNVRYDPARFSGLIWQHGRLGGNCLLFVNGKINCSGKCGSIRESVRRLRGYARLLQRKGCPVTLTYVQVLTISANNHLEDRVMLDCIPFDYRYDPELFPAVMFNRERIHFTLKFRVL